MKNSSMQVFLDVISRKVFGRSRTQCIRKNICVMCGKPAKKFKNAKYRREFILSGTCSKCQDEIRKEDANDGKD